MISNSKAMSPEAPDGSTDAVELRSRLLECLGGDWPDPCNLERATCLQKNLYWGSLLAARPPRKAKPSEATLYTLIPIGTTIQFAQ